MNIVFWREGGLQENIFSQAYEAEIKLVFKNMIGFKSEAAT